MIPPCKVRRRHAKRLGEDVGICPLKSADDEKRVVFAPGVSRGVGAGVQVASARGEDGIRNSRLHARHRAEHKGGE